MIIPELPNDDRPIWERIAEWSEKLPQELLDMNPAKREVEMSDKNDLIALLRSRLDLYVVRVFGTRSDGTSMDEIVAAELTPRHAERLLETAVRDYLLSASASKVASLGSWNLQGRVDRLSFERALSDAEIEYVRAAMLVKLGE